MIDLDRLDQRLDLALEAELRRHIGLDEGDRSPAPSSRRNRRQRRHPEPAWDAFPETGPVHALASPPKDPSPAPEIPAWPPQRIEVPEAFTPEPEPEPEVEVEPEFATEPEPAPTARQPFERRPPSPEPARPSRARSSRPRPEPKPAPTARQPFEKRERPDHPEPEWKAATAPRADERPAPPKRAERPAPAAQLRSAFEKREDRPPGLLQLRLRERKRVGSPLHRGETPAAEARPESRRSAAASDETLQGHARQVVDLMAQGKVHEADEHIAAHATLAESGGPLARRDAAAWAVMRALFDGRHREARRQLDAVRRLGEEAGDPAAEEVYAWQRYWLLMEWGSDAESEELLDYCRQRAYFHNELRWRAALGLLLARMGYSEESAREYDIVMEKALTGSTHDGDWLDIMTNAGETAAILGDPQRAQAAHGALGRSSGTTVVVGRAWVGKGSTARVLGLLAATVGRPTESDRHFGVAMDKHRDMEALPLLARTCTEWGLRLAAREPDGADAHLGEGFELASRLRMTDLADTARAGLDTLRQPIAS